MQNVKCTTSNTSKSCPENKDICCQFCTLNYSPCEGKCSGCWDQIAEIGYDVKVNPGRKADLAVSTM